MKAYAIIPARGGSKTIPHKNVMDFCGEPLITWSIQQAKESKLVKDVYVTSDNDNILEISLKAGAKPIKRPAKFATDTASTEDALAHALDHIEGVTGEKAEVLVLLQVTSPLRMPEDIDNAIRSFTKQQADSLFSAARLEDFCIWKEGVGKWQSLTYDYKNRGRRQDREPLYLENGSIYVFRSDILREYHNRLGKEMAIYLMPFWQSYEIDNAEDVGICEYFMKNKIIMCRALKKGNASDDNEKQSVL